MPKLFSRFIIKAKKAIVTASKFILPSNSIMVVWIGGQSNGAGEGYNSQALSSEIDSTAYAKIWSHINSNFANLNIASGNNYYNNTGKHGLELTMAERQEAIDPGNVLHIIKLAAGGTEIVEHLKGGTVWQNYINNFATKGINQLLASGKRVFFHIIFILGENNSEFQYLVDDAGNELDRLIALYRSKFGTSVPITFVEIFQRTPRTAQYNAMLNQKASVDPYFKVIPNTGLTTNDGLHYDYASLKIIEKRYYDLNIQPIEIITPLLVSPEVVVPATMNLTSVTQVGNTLTVVAELNGGDAVSTPANLWYKLYCGFPVYYRSGTDANDINVSITGSTVTIINIPVVYRYTYDFSIVAVDEQGNASVKSNIITKTITF